MNERSNAPRSASVLLSMAAFVVIVAGLRAAQAIVVPFVVAVFLAMISLPALNWLQKRRLPTWLALLVITIAVLVVMLLFVAIIGTSAAEFRQQLPSYERRVAELQEMVIERLQHLGIDLGEGFQKESFDPQQALTLFGNLLAALAAALGNVMVIVLTLIFMLLEATDFPRKLRAIGGGGDQMNDRWERIQGSVRRYVSLKTQLCIMTGLLVTAWLWFLGVDFPLLWGLLAFLFNYVPNIGSFIAAVPAVAVALLQLGFASAAYVAAGYVAINVVIGGVLEPRLLGRGLGLSPLVVFVSLVFWGWVLGPIGMLFSAPLTMVVKIVLDNSDDLRWFAILLSSDVPETAGEK